MLQPQPDFTASAGGGVAGVGARVTSAVVAEGTAEAIGGWIRRTAERWPDIRPIIRIGRDAAAVEPDLTDIVERWLDEAVSDVEDGLNRADRFDPGVRHFRGVLAMAQLDYVAQNWAGSDWKIDRDRMLDELTDSWVRLLGVAGRTQTRE
ncbi:hypothetical protein AB0F81_37990 [Actinoplanes sp. NPDC024001]|uniref:hypothetical protein n=1 Tax=Actinoplanes sp. NPDC024001 TaxID=3154598 RepID=UPI0033FEA42F